MINNYKSRISFNFYKLPLNIYTICIEFMTDDMSKFQSLTCVSSTFMICNQSTKVFSNYSWSIININKSFQTAPIYLFIDIHILGDSSSLSQLPCYMVIYGQTGTVSNIQASVYDQLYSIENNSMKMQTNIDMNNNSLTGLKYPIQDNDASTKNYVDFNNALNKRYVDTQISNISPKIKQFHII